MAAAAYRAGASLLDQRTGQVFDYTRKGGVIESRMVLPDGVELADIMAKPALAATTLSAPEKAMLARAGREALGEDEARGTSRTLGAVSTLGSVRSLSMGQDEVTEDHAREHLWNAAEAAERYKTARVAREWLLALPHELSAEDRAECAYRFAQAWANRHGVAVDVSLHEPDKKGDERNWHAHLLCTTRRLTADGALGQKAAVELGDKDRAKLGLGKAADEITAARQLWAYICNEALERAGLSERIDHRSNAARGIELEPTKHVGVHATAMHRKGVGVERAAELEAARHTNAEAIRQEPEKVLAAITSREAVFTRHDIARELNRYIDDPREFQALMARLEQSPALIELAPEVRGEHGRVIEPARYSTRDMVATERGMIEAVRRMDGRRSHGVDPRGVAEAIERAGTLTSEQRAAVEHILDGRQVAAVIGDAGTGKSFSMKVAREAWEAAGYRVIGAALAGKAADGLREGAGIESRTLHAWELAWQKAEEKGHTRDRLNAKTVLVIDEAGMVGSRQLARVIAAAEKAGAKVVLVGDDKQLQAVEAGAPFRAVVERIGAAEITEIRRQKESWAKAASMAFSRRSVREGLDAYQARGHVRMAATGEDARRALVADYLADARPTSDKVILAHRNADVRALNEAVRAHRREAGELGAGALFATTSGPREFAAGDRIVFLKNDRELAVKNGMLGTVETAGEDGRLAVRLDNGERRSVEPGAYADLDHGYAVTVHKAQGVTVDRAFVLASSTMDKHLAYVAMTRHRGDATLYAGMDEFGQHAGRLVAHGRAPYEHNADNRDSYYVTLEAANGQRRTVWGVDLGRALTESGAKVGDAIRLDHVGAETVTLPTGEQARRNTWRVATGEGLAYERLAERLGRERPKASTLDYLVDFAERRGFDGLAVARRLVERGREMLGRLKGRLDAAAERLGLTPGQVRAEAPAATQAPSWTAQGRVDLVVPFSQKDRAKAAGARFDGETRRWYAPAGADMAKLAEWLPQEQAKRRAEQVRPTQEATPATRPGGGRRASLSELVDGTPETPAAPVARPPAEPARPTPAATPADRGAGASTRPDPLARFRAEVEAARKAPDLWNVEVAEARLERAKHYLREGVPPAHAMARILAEGEKLGIERYKARQEAKETAQAAGVLKAPEDPAALAKQMLAAMELKRAGKLGPVSPELAREIEAAARTRPDAYASQLSKDEPRRAALAKALQPHQFELVEKVKQIEAARAEARRQQSRDRGGYSL